MEEEHIFNKVRDILVDYLGIDSSKLTLSSLLRRDLKLDRFDLAELSVYMESEFNKPIELDENTESISDIINLLKN